MIPAPLNLLRREFLKKYLLRKFSWNAASGSLRFCRVKGLAGHFALTWLHTLRCTLQDAKNNRILLVLIYLAVSWSEEECSLGFPWGGRVDVTQPLSVSKLTTLKLVRDSWSKSVLLFCAMSPYSGDVTLSNEPMLFTSPHAPSACSALWKVLDWQPWKLKFSIHRASTSW